MTDSATSVLSTPASSPAPSGGPAPSPAPAAAPTPAPSPSAFDWKSQGLADEDIGYLETKAYKTPGDVLKALRGAEKLVGLDKLPMPKDETDTEGWNRVFQRLGRPETADKYDLGKLPDGHDKEYIGHMLKNLHAAGASQKVVTAALKAQTEFESARSAKLAEARDAQSATEMTALKSEWGQGYDTQLQHARNFANKNGIDKPTMEKIEGAIGPAAMLKLFAKVGAQFAEDKGPLNDGTGNDFGKLTPAQAKYQIEQLKADKEFVRQYTQGTEAERKLAIQKMTLLQQAAAAV